MTKKDFVRAARLVAGIQKQHCCERTAVLLLSLFEGAPRFDGKRFLLACDVRANLSLGDALRLLAA